MIPPRNTLAAAGVSAPDDPGCYCDPGQGGCGQYKPHTKEFWHEHGQGRLRTDLCKVCRNAAEQRAVRMRETEAIREADALAQGALRAALASGGKNLPHIREVIEITFRKIGGVEGFTNLLVAQILSAPPGGVVRGKLLTELLKINQSLSEGGLIEDDLERLTDEELEGRLRELGHEFLDRIGSRGSAQMGRLRRVGPKLEPVPVLEHSPQKGAPAQSDASQ